MLAKVTTSNSAVPAGSDSSWQDKGGSTVVLTAHAIYYPTMGWGDERVRVFSRQTRAGMYLDPDGTGTYWTGSAAKTIRANVGFRAENYSTDSRLMINQTEPAESNSITTTIEQFFYELLGYKLYGFTGTIQSIVNGFQASTLKKSADGQPDNYYFQYNNINGLGIDLSDTYTYDQADKANNGKQASSTALFRFSLHPQNINFPVRAYGRVMYQGFYSNPYGSSYQYVYAWSGLANVYHTVNTQ